MERLQVTQGRRSINPPLPIIDSAKLLFFAENDDDVTYTGKLSLHVGGPENWQTIGELPGLVIVNPYNNPEDFLLGFCDESWAVSGAIQFGSVEAAKARAERYYAGVSDKWQATPYSDEQTREYLRIEYEVDPDSEWWVVRCSFCGKEDTDTEGVIASESANICYGCIDYFYKEILNSD